MIEPLDFCRVKKIDEKGFGFLRGLHYPVDVFFHFSQIKKEEFRDKLNEMKRGDFFLYFISRKVDANKRKVSQIWYSLENVPSEYIPLFCEKIIEEFRNGKTNLFDLLFAFDELKKLNALSQIQFEEILGSSRIINLPTTIIPHLNSEEIEIFKRILNYDELKMSDSKPFWFDDIS